MSMVPPVHPATLPLVSKLAAGFVEPVKGMATRTKEKLEVRFRLGFAKYLEEQTKRFGSVKTIISQSSPLPFHSLYVNLHLNCENINLRDDDFVKLDPKYKNILFTATAGSGKSMLMRYLFLQLLEVQDERLPVFIELRDLNLQPSVTLMDFVRQRLESYIDGFSERQLKYALEKNKIILLLDGFDEVEYDKRSIREKEISELCGRYNNVHVFLSSRPFDTATGWERFYVFKVQALSERQVKLLVDKIPYDEDIKLIFKKKLQDDFYQKHKGFLANPLLCVMMLLTIEYFAEIPAKIHVFYGRAFDALFGRHDTMKGGFQRKMHAALAADDFKRLFSYFCAISYMKQRLNFSPDDLLQMIGSAVKSSQIKADVTAFKNDLVESTCMLIPDGLDYTFSHRSFQEYFAAYFLTQVATNEFTRAIPILVQRATFDDVIQMLFEMNRERFEEAWALPQLETMVKSLELEGTKTNPIAYCNNVLGKTQLHITNNRIQVQITGNQEKVLNRLVLFRIYGLFDKITSRLKNVSEHDTLVVSKIRAGTLLSKDPRFDKVRTSSSKHLSILIDDLREEDGKWFKDTYFGKYLQKECELLPILFEEVKSRVAERAMGLESLFLDLSEMPRRGPDI